MNRGGYRPPTTSRASATTLCQKCLKRGHFSYECKATAQDRPYIPRPSRTQQLLNPKLAPKLTNDAMEELTNKKGVADAELAKAAAARGRKRSMSIDGEDKPRKRSRSTSSRRSSSVSTISTSRSRSASRRRNDSPDDRMMTSQYEERESADSSFDRKRRRNSSAGSREDHMRRKGDRNTRRRRNERSPGERGRRTSRMEYDVERNSRSWSRSRSRQKGSRRSRSMQRPRNGARYARSPSPYRQAREAPSRAAPPEERSLSPYSKRIALTQAMNSGR